MLFLAPRICILLRVTVEIKLEDLFKKSFKSKNKINN